MTSERIRHVEALAEAKPRSGALAARAANTGVWLLLVVGAARFMLPLYVMLAMSLKTPDEIANSSTRAWPSHLVWSNYRTVLTDPGADLARKLVNALILSAVRTIGVVLTSALLAYPFARLRFAGRDRLFLVLHATMMLPAWSP